MMGRSDRDESALSRARFEAALDRFGGAIEQWPETERVHGRSFVEAHPDAGVSLRAASEVDAALRLLAAPPAESAHEALVIDGQILFRDRRALPRRRAPAPVNVRRLAAWGSAMLAASLLVGFVAGSSSSTPQEDDGTIYTLLDADSGNLL